MAANTKIEWAHHTFNPWIGCTEVSPGCNNCYARTLVNGRMGRDFSVPTRTSPDYWKQPHTWNKRAKAHGVRYRVFPSLCDPFDNQAPQEWRADLYELIQATPYLDWLLLTKRPQNIFGMWPARGAAPMFDNVWLGTTVENQKEADRRIPHLLKIRSVVHFLSAEPLLGQLEIAEWTPLLDWVICGGESGKDARPMHPQWARNLRDQCVTAKVPFFFKQWGEWADIDGPKGVASTCAARADRQRGDFYFSPEGAHIDRGRIGGSAYANSLMRRVGKRNAGRMLDGRMWDQFPDGVRA